MKSTRASVWFRDGRLVLRDVLDEERRELLRAGFRRHTITLTRDDGSTKEADLWIQDTPSLTQMLNAVHLMFDDEPGSISWVSGTP